MFNLKASPLNFYSSPKNLLLKSKPILHGIHTPYVYCGGPGSKFSWHVKDYHLYSSNFVIDGAAKHWYSIPGAYIHKFADYLKGKL